MLIWETPLLTPPRYQFCHRLAGLLLVVPALLLLGCDREPSSLTSTTDLASNSGSLEAVAAIPDSATVYGEPDKTYLQFAREHPTFGGAFFEDGEMRVVTTDGSMPAGLEIGHPETPKTAVQGKYSFRTLARWYGPFVQVIQSVDWIYTDIDERKNRLVAGVKDVSVARSVLQAAGIPSGIFEIVEGQSGTITKSLNDSFNPVPGGVEANGTLGFNVSHWDEGRTFVVTDHQTETFAQNDGSLIGQPDGTRIVGHEVHSEPLFQGSPCPTTWCRYSDAALMAYDSEDASQLGKVARPDQDESRTVVGRYVIDGENRSISSGTPLIWVGSTTGQESGEVHTTCFNADYNDFFEDAPPGTTLLCQFEASPNNESGDSGAPVLIPVGGDTVRLAGMLWGGNHYDDFKTDQDAVFSPITGIRREIDPDSSVFCDGLETRAGGGCHNSGTGGSGEGDDGDCGPYAVQECQ